MAEQTIALSVRNIRKSFAGISVLKDVSFDVARGTVTALVGSNGAGKSTLVNVLTGALAADAGEVWLAGRELRGLRPFERARAGLLRTFQHPRVFSSFSVGRSLRLARTSAREEGLVASALSVFRRRSSPSSVAAVGEIERRLATKADVVAADLSYGDKKLLMLSQLLAMDGQVICLDEVCAGLESHVVGEIRECLLLLARQGTTVLFVEHNLALVRSLASRVIFLHQGRVFRDGPVDQVLTDPEVVGLYLGE